MPFDHTWDLNPSKPHTCGGTVEYNEWHDAYFCRACDEWLSEPCSATDHSECGFDCETRPEKPSGATQP